MADLTQQDGASQQVWDAAQCEAALAHLERLQEQLDGLRMAIPSIVAPLLQPNRPKPKLFADIKEAALGATKELHAFRDSWNSEQTRNTLARSKESYRENSDLSRAVEVPRWGWTRNGS